MVLGSIFGQGIVDHLCLPSEERGQLCWIWPVWTCPGILLRTSPVSLVTSDVPRRPGLGFYSRTAGSGLSTVTMAGLWPLQATRQALEILPQWCWMDSSTPTGNDNVTFTQWWCWTDSSTPAHAGTHDRRAGQLNLEQLDKLTPSLTLFGCQKDTDITSHMYICNSIL